MRISDLGDILEGSFVQPAYDDRAIDSVYTSDLLSDVIAHADRGAVLVTVQAHVNTVAVALDKESPAVIVCNGRVPPDDMLASARRYRIAIFRTERNQFETSGILFGKLRP